jgi:hypothetical protein
MQAALDRAREQGARQLPVDMGWAANANGGGGAAAATGDAADMPAAGGTTAGRPT